MLWVPPQDVISETRLQLGFMSRNDFVGAGADVERKAEMYQAYSVLGWWDKTELTLGELLELLSQR